MLRSGAANVWVQDTQQGANKLTSRIMRERYPGADFSSGIVYAIVCRRQFTAERKPTTETPAVSEIPLLVGKTRPCVVCLPHTAAPENNFQWVMTGLVLLSPFIRNFHQD